MNELGFRNGVIWILSHKAVNNRKWKNESMYVHFEQARGNIDYSVVDLPDLVIIVIMCIIIIILYDYFLIISSYTMLSDDSHY